MPSLFSRILAGTLPAAIVANDGPWAAFLDIAPVAPGHLLVVPRYEAPLLADLPPDVLAALGPFLARAVRAVRAATGAPAVNILVNDGAAAGQAVPHVHLHVIPRTTGDGRWTPPHGQTGTDLAPTLAALRVAWR
jgi:histidine triad (HIT) family protein